MDETYVPTKRRPTTEAILWVMDGDRRGKWYPIHAGTKIGRKNVDMVLDDDQVSAMHARITVEGGKYYIWDSGSSNWTFVNGKRIREATLIDENDKIKIGKTTFVLKLLDAKKKNTCQAQHLQPFQVEKRALKLHQQRKRRQAARARYTYLRSI